MQMKSGSCWDDFINSCFITDAAEVYHQTEINKPLNLIPHFWRYSFKNSPYANIQNNPITNLPLLPVFTAFKISSNAFMFKGNYATFSERQTASCICESCFWSPGSAGCLWRELRLLLAAATPARALPPLLVDFLVVSRRFCRMDDTSSPELFFLFFCGTCPICWPWMWP